jgi:superfamily I DNA/RNA helicase
MRSLQAYERALDTRRLCDPEMLGMLAVEGDTSKRYRSVLVDEYQDLGVLELRALLRSVADAPDSIFLAGDARQQVFPKRLSLAESGLPTPTRRRFQKNYRNTQEILDCAWEMLQSSAAGEEGSSLDEADRLKPELSKRRGEQPAVIRADGLEEEHAFVAACVKEHRKTSDAPVCICVCGIRDDEPEYLEGMAEVYRQLGIETRLLSGDAKPQPGVTFLASLETVKGFEFPMVLITQCGAREIPNPGQPAEEAWRDGRRLYVAMTRARDLLVISYHGEQSSFVGAFGEKANFTSIEDYLGFVPELTCSPICPRPIVESVLVLSARSVVHRGGARSPWSSAAPRPDASREHCFA